MKEFELDIDLKVDEVYGLPTSRVRRTIIEMIEKNFGDIEVDYFTHNETTNVTSILFLFKAKDLYEAKLRLLELYIGEDGFDKIKVFEEAFEAYAVNDAFEGYETVQKV